MTNDGTVVLHGFNDAPQIVETVPIVATVMREHGQGYKKIWLAQGKLLFPGNENRGETKGRRVGSIDDYPSRDRGFVST